MIVFKICKEVMLHAISSIALCNDKITMTFDKSGIVITAHDQHNRLLTHLKIKKDIFMDIVFENDDDEKVIFDVDTSEFENTIQKVYMNDAYISLKVCSTINFLTVETKDNVNALCTETIGVVNTNVTISTPNRPIDTFITIPRLNFNKHVNHLLIKKYDHAIIKLNNDKFIMEVANPDGSPTDHKLTYEFDLPKLDNCANIERIFSLHHLKNFTKSNLVGSILRIYLPADLDIIVIEYPLIDKSTKKEYASLKYMIGVYDHEHEMEVRRSAKLSRKKRGRVGGI